MMKLSRFLLWLAGVAVFLLATAHFTLLHLLNAPKFKAAATGYVARLVGRSADYGRIDYGLFPFSLVVRDAAIKEADGIRIFASIKACSVRVDLRAEEIAALTLEKPVVRIARRPDGSFNFSDLLPAAATKAEPGESATEPPPPPVAPAAPPAAADEPAEPAAKPLAIRLVQIQKARIEFVDTDSAGVENSFAVSDLDFLLRDCASDRPVQATGRAAIGGKSSLDFELSGPPPAGYADNPGAWPVRFDARLDIRDFADLRAFLPPDTLPFQTLWATLHVEGSLADDLSVLLDIETPGEATKDFPVSLNVRLQADLSLPAPVAAHLLAGAPLPEEWVVDFPPCELPAGGTTLTDEPALGLLLRHAQGTGKFSFPKIDYGQNRFSDGEAAFFLRGGTLALPEAKGSAYGGAIEARGNVQLLACPLTYRIERLSAERLAVEQIVAANALDGLERFTGRLRLEASGGGYAVAEPGLRSLEADATARIDDLQSIGTGGSLMDQVWLQLDYPLLLKLVPRMKPKVADAQAAATAVTTSRYDEATATLSLRNGTATLSDARLAMPDYRLDLSGAILPFDDRLDLTAKLVASREETARLTDGKDISSCLPYEDGGFTVPLSIRGPMQKPEVRSALDSKNLEECLQLLLNQALEKVAGGESESLLDELSDSDRKHVEKGLRILGDFLQ
ncbi:MAG: AsmA-like C-terminal region-containing protein [Kiritimatiellia bacterium]